MGPVDAYVVTHHAQSFPLSMGAYYHGLSACPKAELVGLRPRVAILSLVTAVELTLLWWARRVFAAPLPTLKALTGRWAEPVMLAGASTAAYGLAFVAAEGFAPYGHPPWLTAVIFGTGVLLVSLANVERKPQPATSQADAPNADSAAS